VNNRTRAIVWVLAVFLIGALSGGGMVYIFMAPRSTAWHSTTNTATRPPRGPRDNPDRMIEELSRVLALSEEQKTQVREIFEGSRKDYHLAFREVRTKTHRKLEHVLNPEQMKKFDEFMREREKARDRGRGEKPPGPAPKQP